MADLRPEIGPALDVFGLPATVTLPGEEPVATRAIWLSPVALETSGVIVSSDRPQRALVLPRSDVPSVPRGTLVEMAEEDGGDVLTWAVEAVLGATQDEIRVVVIAGDSG